MEYLGILDGMYTNELEQAKSLAREAGEIMRQYFDGNQEMTIKEDHSPLTIADTKINRLVIERLEAVFPDDGVIGEEESTVEFGMGRIWFCDPIDGTSAFTWGVPTAMFSLALVIDGRPVVGVCYEPMLDKLYWAVAGEGAYCNGRRLSVNTQTLEMGLLGIISDAYRLRHEAPYIDTLIDRHVNLAPFYGAVAKCVRIAEGRLAGYLEEYVSAHDVAASQVIVTEAGGRMTGLDGNEIDYSRPFKGVIVSNGIVHDELVRIVGETLRK